MEGLRGAERRPTQLFNLLKRRSSAENRLHFLTEAIEEQVIPRSAPAHLKSSEHPFSIEARQYLNGAASTLKDKIEEISERLAREEWPATDWRQRAMLRRIDRNQKRKLGHRLKSLIDQSPWKDAGRLQIIRNLSSRELNQVESEALSFGLKFAIGGPGGQTPLDTHIKNYRRCLGVTENGFIQGITYALMESGRRQDWSLPRRYRQALEKLGSDRSIFISSADKGGGVVILDSDAYARKMGELLSAGQTYSRVPKGNAARKAGEFNKNVRSILRNSVGGRSLEWLLEDTPRTPTMRGLPKVHKPNVPLRPITSGIGSAPHRLAKVLAKPLSERLGEISGCHLRNSADFKSQVSRLSMEGKQMISFDVSALFTNVPVDEALEAAERVVDGICADDLPLRKDRYLELIRHCVQFTAFEFQGEEYQQDYGMAMGSPLSAVLACLFMEVLESESIIPRLPQGSTWLRYVDDTWVALPQDCDTEAVLQSLNAIHPSIKFTMEKENNGRIPFLDTLVERKGAGLEFRVYRKPTNKDDFIHFYSAHPHNIKTQCVLGFLLRAHRICDAAHLEDEIKYIVDAFRELRYPGALLRKLIRRAEEIWRRGPKEDKCKYRMVVPKSEDAMILAKRLSPAVQIVMSSGRTIGNQVCRKRTKTVNNDSIVYAIPCRDCERSYYGMTHRGLHKRMTEHKADMRYDRPSNAMVTHRRDYDHTPDFNQARVVSAGLTKPQRLAVEAANIKLHPNTNTQAGFYSWALPVAQAITRSRRG